MKRGIEVRPEQYYRAALERLEMVDFLRKNGQGASVVAAYLSGLAVECMLRSFIPPSAEFYPEHLLVQIARRGVVEGVDDALTRIRPSLNDVSTLWRNSLRFYSADRFEAWCSERTRAGAPKRLRGSRASKVLCERLHEGSARVVTECKTWRK